MPPAHSCPRTAASARKRARPPATLAREGTRKSSRLRGVSAPPRALVVADAGQEDEANDGTIVYADAPDAPDQLDDFEFEIYIG